MLRGRGILAGKPPDTCLHAGIGGRRDGTQFLLDGIIDVECVNEAGYALRSHALIGARERFERLVGVGVALSAEDSLYALGDDRPGILQILAQLLLVENELAQSLESAVESDEGVMALAMPRLPSEFS